MTVLTRDIYAFQSHSPVAWETPLDMIYINVTQEVIEKHNRFVYCSASER